MSERKGINKYYPIDYDHTKLQRIKKPKNAQSKARIGLPMSVQCITCGNYMAKNTKFNARKEVVPEEAYLGNNAYRFYFRCSQCFQELTFKTDPKNADYVCEHGIKPSYANTSELDAKAAEVEAEKETLNSGDVMRQLEQKSLISLAEMETNEAIDDALLKYSQRSMISVEELHELARRSSMLDPTISDDEEEWEEEDLKELEEFKQKLAKRTSYESVDEVSGKRIKRLAADEAGLDEAGVDSFEQRARIAKEQIRARLKAQFDDHQKAETQTETLFDMSTVYPLTTPFDTPQINKTPSILEEIPTPQKQPSVQETVKGFGAPVFSVPIRISPKPAVPQTNVSLEQNQGVSSNIKPKPIGLVSYSKRNHDSE